MGVINITTSDLEYALQSDYTLEATKSLLLDHLPEDLQSNPHLVGETDLISNRETEVA